MKVYSSPNIAMVGHFKNVLEMNGIACDIHGEFRGAGLGELPPIECWPELWVRNASELERAKEIIEEALQSTNDEMEHWKCPSCDEEVEGQFAVCWNCETNRPSHKNR